MEIRAEGTVTAGGVVSSDDSATANEEEQITTSVEEIIGIAPVGDELRLVTIRADGRASFVDPHSQRYSLLYLTALVSSSWKSDVKELEELINSPQVTEPLLQSFFENNPHILCGDDYQAARPHIVLQRQSEGPLIPDFALQPTNERALCDLLDLKLPQAKLVVGRNNRRRLSAAVLEVCAQLREYQAFFDLPQNRDAVRDTYGLSFFRPKLIAVMGKRSDYSAHDFRKAEADLPQLTIVTYDDLIARARSRIRMR